MLLGVILVLIGIGVLAVAADQFVAGASFLARHFGVSPVVVGAVIIGFGTSAPEMLVSGIAANNTGEPDLAVGNIIGSNVANLTLVLGSAAIVTAIAVDRPVLRREAPLSAICVILFAITVQGGLNLFEGIVLLVVLVLTLAIAIIGSDVNPDMAGIPSGEGSVGGEILRTLVGLGATVGASLAFVEGADRIATELGVSGGFIGLTVAAVGTSLPELVTSVMAARRGETDLLVGNVLGSNIFNSTAVGAVVAFVAPGELTDSALSGRPVVIMLVAAIGVWILMGTARKLTRWEGILTVTVWLAALPLLPR